MSEVHKEVFARANGCCEGCGQKRPTKLYGGRRSVEGDYCVMTVWGGPEYIRALCDDCASF